MAQLNKVARFSWDCRCEWVSQLFDSYCLKKQVQIYRDMIGPSACNQLYHVWCSQKAQPIQVIFYIQLTLDISDQLVTGWLDVTPQQSFPAFHVYSHSYEFLFLICTFQWFSQYGKSDLLVFSSLNTFGEICITLSSSIPAVPIPN